ncbi:hypothetical protein AAG570_011791 [Ranatra chinensis]|uniref:Uncharacterized protein n=1 Tax=Ranatra chinensis TaxID=642074 RepID=A0ABD0YGX6_9HEMI
MARESRKNTYRNAEKLLTAAEELAQTGECNAEEIYSVAQELERHVTSFAARVEQRRRRLDLAVLFYTHEKEFCGGLVAAVIYPVHRSSQNGTLSPGQPGDVVLDMVPWRSRKPFPLLHLPFARRHQSVIDVRCVRCGALDDGTSTIALPRLQGPQARFQL